jgi:hypothetical protein
VGALAAFALEAFAVGGAGAGLADKVVSWRACEVSSDELLSTSQPLAATATTKERTDGRREVVGRICMPILYAERCSGLSR